MRQLLLLLQQKRSHWWALLKVQPLLETAWKNLKILPLYSISFFTNSDQFLSMNSKLYKQPLSLRVRMMEDNLFLVREPGS